MASSLHDDLARIRLRPGMYIGGTGSWSLRAMLHTLVEELLATPGATVSRVEVIIGSDAALTLLIDGIVPGVWQEELGSMQMPANGIWSPLTGLTIAIALSEEMTAEVAQPDSRWTRRFERGIPCDETPARLAADQQSIRLRLVPDRSIFAAGARIDFHPFCGGMREQAIFCPATTFVVHDVAENLYAQYRYPRGLHSYLEEIEAHAIGFLGNESQIYHLKLKDGDDSAEAVILDENYGGRIVHVFVNGHWCRDGGSPVLGLAKGYSDVLARYPDLVERRHFNGPDDVLNGRTILLSLRLAEPEWAGSVRNCLRGRRPAELVYHMVTSQLPELLDKRIG